MTDFHHHQLYNDYNGNNILLNNNSGSNILLNTTNGNNILHNKKIEYISPTHHKANRNNLFVYPSKIDDPTDVHIDRNVLIEPHPVESPPGGNHHVKVISPPRTPSPNTSDGDSGYSSKQMSPVSMVRI